MISYTRQDSRRAAGRRSRHGDDYIAPAPRVSVQAFCATVETAAAVRAAGEDRRLGKANLTDQNGRHRQPPSKPITPSLRRT